MTRPISDIAFTPSVKAVQERLGSRRIYSGASERGGWSDVIGEDLAEFIAGRDSLYLATATADGQPYIQHRGGPKGFLRVLDGRTLAFADFSGNRQYVSMGNLAENDKAYIFLMDYPNRRRVKIWGRAEVIEDDPELAAKLSDPSYKGVPERVFLFHVSAWDINCPQHIPRRYTEEEFAPELEGLRARIAELKAEAEGLRKKLAAADAA